jgi:hypothetical protein
MVSPILKGLKMSIKIPLMISENAFCEAKPNIAAKIPALANKAVPTERRGGIVKMIKMSVLVYIIKLIEFFKKEKFVGLAFSFSAYVFYKLVNDPT